MLPLRVLNVWLSLNLDAAWAALAWVWAPASPSQHCAYWTSTLPFLFSVPLLPEVPSLSAADDSSQIQRKGVALCTELDSPREFSDLWAELGICLRSRSASSIAGWKLLFLDRSCVFSCICVQERRRRRNIGFDTTRKKFSRIPHGNGEIRLRLYIQNTYRPPSLSSPQSLSRDGEVRAISTSWTPTALWPHLPG